MKKLLALLLALSMMLALAACGGDTSGDTTGDTGDAAATETEDTTSADDGAEAEETGDSAEATGTAIDPSEIQIGVIYIGDEQEAYTANHYNGLVAACEALGIDPDTQVINRWTVPESEAAADALYELADSGCDIIFATSFGHESYVLQVAAEYPDIQFFHATGYQAAGSELTNVHNYFADIYQARFLGGVAAGMKLQEMIDNGTITEDQAKVGYVGAYPFAEVISGFTSFYLGVRSVCPSAEMQVTYVNSWSDAALESEAAQQLIADGCVIISQHSDTTGPATVCQTAQESGNEVYFVGYNIDMTAVAPDACLTSAKINWNVPMQHAIEAVLNGEAAAVDASYGLEEEAVEITPLNTAIIAEGTQEAVDADTAAIIDGSLQVFDTSTFTVGGETITSTVDIDGYNGNEYIVDGAFAESTLASAPAFAFIIDGVTAPEA